MLSTVLIRNKDRKLGQSCYQMDGFRCVFTSCKHTILSPFLMNRSTKMKQLVLDRFIDSALLNISYTAHASSPKTHVLNSINFPSTLHFNVASFHSAVNSSDNSSESPQLPLTAHSFLSDSNSRIQRRSVSQL